MSLQHTSALEYGVSAPMIPLTKVDNTVNPTTESDPLWTRRPDGRRDERDLGNLVVSVVNHIPVGLGRPGVPVNVQTFTQIS